MEKTINELKEDAELLKGLIESMTSDTTLLNLVDKLIDTLNDSGTTFYKFMEVK